jgi:Protein of unknown function (DUF2726)
MSEAAALLALAALAALVAIYGEWGPRSGRRRSQNRPAPYAVNLRTFTPSPRAWDASEQLRLVMRAPFHARPVLSRAELPVFFATQKAVADLGLPWCVLAQVSLGEVLGSADEEGFRAINSKRVDVLLMAEDGQPIAAIEYQGAGHYQSNAAARDAVKKEALRKAAIGYIEMREGHRPADLAREIARIAALRGEGEGKRGLPGCAIPRSDPAESANPNEILRLAESYRRAASRMRETGSPGGRLASAPYRLLAIHAVELHLNALLRHAGVNERQVRGMGHNLAARAAKAEGIGLRLRPAAAAHLATMTGRHEYMLARYGPIEDAEVSEVTRLAATLDEVAVKTAELMALDKPTSPQRTPSPGRTDSHARHTVTARAAAR